MFVLLKLSTLIPRCCREAHFNIVAAISPLLPSNISFTLCAIELSSAMNFEISTQIKTKYGIFWFTGLENVDASPLNLLYYD